MISEVDELFLVFNSWKEISLVPIFWNTPDQLPLMNHHAPYQRRNNTPINVTCRWLNPDPGTESYKQIFYTKPLSHFLRYAGHFSSVVAVKGQQQRPWKRTASPGDDPLRGMTCIDAAARKQHTQRPARLGEITGKWNENWKKWRVQLQRGYFESAGAVTVWLLNESMNLCQQSKPRRLLQSIGLAHKWWHIWPSGK